MTFKQSGTDLFNLCEMKFNRQSKLVNWSTLQVQLTQTHPVWDYSDIYTT